MRAVCQSVAFSAAILACNGSVVNGLKLRAGADAATVPLTREGRTGTAQQVGSKVFGFTDACRKRGSYFFGGDVYNEKGEKIRFEREWIMKLIGAGLFHKVFKHPNWKHSEKELKEAAEQYTELMIVSGAQKAQISELEATVSDLETKKITLEKTQAAALEKQRVELTSSLERQRVELTTQLAQRQSEWEQSFKKQHVESGQKHLEWQEFHTNIQELYKNEMAKKNQEMANIQEFYKNEMAKKDRHHETEMAKKDRHHEIEMAKIQGNKYYLHDIEMAKIEESWGEKYSTLEEKYKALEQKFQDRTGSVENDDGNSEDPIAMFIGDGTGAHVVDTPVTEEESLGDGRGVFF